MLKTIYFYSSLINNLLNKITKFIKNYTNYETSN